MFGGGQPNATVPNTSVPNDMSNKAKDVMDSMRTIASSNMGLVVIVGIMFFVIVYVLVFIFRQYNSTALKTVTMVKKPIKAPSDRVLNISGDTGLPKLNYINGKEFSYSFWVYIEGDNNRFTDQNKFILGRSETSSDMSQSASPLFELDKLENKMIVTLSTTSSGTDLRKTLTINYFPLQRWVNVVLVVDNNFVQLFVDGELKEVSDLSEFQNNSSIVKDPVGNLYIGSSSTTPSFDGYISKVQAFNYAVSIDHAKVIYKAGPLHKTVLSMIGISTYGIQNPIYRIDEKDQMKENCST